MATARFRPVERLAGKSIHYIFGAHHVHEQPGHLLLDLLLVEVAALAQRKGHVFPHAEGIEKRAVLEDHGDALANSPQTLFVEVRDLLAFDAN